MVAMLAFGGTFAYFTATTSEKSATLTTGKVSLTANSSVKFEQESGKVVPGDPIVTGDVAYTSDSTVDTYVAIVFNYTSEGATDDQLAELKKAIAITTENTWEECGTTEGVYIYKSGESYKLAGKDTTQNLDFVKGGIKFSKTYNENYADGVSDKAAKSIENITFTISFQAYSIQADNVTVTGSDAESIWTAMKTVLGDLVK